jgi:hypothetical protein
MRSARRHGSRLGYTSPLGLFSYAAFMCRWPRDLLGFLVGRHHRVKRMPELREPDARRVAALGVAPCSPAASGLFGATPEPGASNVPRGAGTHRG